MPDPIWYDAINVLKYSPTGQGARDVSGGPDYKLRYERIIRAAISKLWNLWATDRIVFYTFDPQYKNFFGFAHSSFGIWINENLKPDINNYGAPVNQSKLAGISAVLLHEAAHLVNERGGIEDEVVCRIAETLYAKDLENSRKYTSRVDNSTHRCKIIPNSTIMGKVKRNLDTMKWLHKNNRMVDYVLSMKFYREKLTAEFVRRSIHWWGGVNKRWPETRGMYIKVLTYEDRDVNLPFIYGILDSIPNTTDWKKAQPWVDLLQLRRWLALALYRDTLTRNQIADIERRIGEKLL